MSVVAIAGGTSGIGRSIADAFDADGKHEYIIFSRSPSESSNIVTVDYTNVETLTDILTSHNVHTIISALSINDDDSGRAQMNLIKAADAAECTKRFIPSEFGMVYTPTNITHLPSYSWKLKAAAALETTALEFTLVSNGIFLDYWSTPKIPTRLSQTPAMWIDFANTFAAIPGDGNTPLVLTHSRDVGPFIVAMLDMPSWEKRSFIIGDRITLNQAVALAQDIMGTSFTVRNDSVNVLESGEATLTPSIEKMLPADSPYTPEFRRTISLAGLVLIKGNIDLDTQKSLNKLFPQIPTLTVRDVAVAWSTDKER